VNKIAAVIKARQKGQALEDAIEATFAPQQPVPPAGAPTMVEQMSPVPEGVPAGGALTPEGQPMPPEAQGPAPEIAQPRPDIQTILASLSASGKAGGRVTTQVRQ
jgi:hypothetical protein